MSDKQKAEELQVTALPTSALEAKLRTLREQSQKHSQALTQKLATSQSGQNLLHIGTSLSTLPPDLHSLLTQLHPLLSATEGNEKECFELLEKLVACANDIRILQRRIDNAQECAQLYQDLEAAERNVKRDARSTTDNVDMEQDSILGMQQSLDSCDLPPLHVMFVSRPFCIIRQCRPCVIVGTCCTHDTVFSTRLTVEYRSTFCIDTSTTRVKSSFTANTVGSRYRTCTVSHETCSTYSTIGIGYHCFLDKSTGMCIETIATETTRK